MEQEFKYDLVINIAKKCINKRNHILKDKVKEHGINIPEADIIMFLAENNDVNTASEIVRECCVSKAFVSKLVIGLLAKKLITIKKDANDKRCQKIQLTKRAQEISEELNVFCYNFMVGLTEGIAEEEKESIRNVFYTVEKNLEKIK